jgi:hypothetical protein
MVSQKNQALDSCRSLQISHAGDKLEICTLNLITDLNFVFILKIISKFQDLCTHFKTHFRFYGIVSDINLTSKGHAK